MKCENCGIKNSPENNYCGKCGEELNNELLCEVCREIKKCKSLPCGHSFCEECLEMVYSTNKKCPKCRSLFEQCTKCQGFRLFKGRCLDCYGKHSKYLLICKFCNFPYNDSPINDFLLECINCKRKLITTIPILSDHYDSSKIIHKNEINPDFKLVCCKCLSSNLSVRIDENIVFRDCNNCESKNVNTIEISTKNLFKLEIINKHIVNPTLVKLCKTCFSDKVLKICDSKDPNIKSFYYCNNCLKNNSECLLVPTIHKKYYPLLSKDVVNPTMIKICKKCHCCSFKHIDKDKIYCSNCSSLCLDFHKIPQNHIHLYPIKNIIENT